MTKEFVKNYRENITEIKNELENINKIVEKLPESSWKKSLTISVVNFQKKIDGFLEFGGELTESQKKAIRAIKSGKLSEAEISEISSRMEAQLVKAQSETENKPTKKGKK